MDTGFESDMAIDDSTESKRDIIRQSLNEIAVEVSNGLRHADLNYSVYLVIPGSGSAIMSMMTTSDPSDPDWCRIGDIVRGIIAERLDGIRLRSVEMTCAMVNATMGTAEITAD